MGSRRALNSVMFLMLLCMGGWLSGCANRSQVRMSALPAHKPTVVVQMRWKTRDPRWNSFLQGAAHEVLMQEGYEVLANPTQRPGASGHAALLRSVGLKPMPASSSGTVAGAELTVQVAAWTESSGGDVRGMATAKILEQPNGRLVGNATASGRAAAASSQTGALESTKEAVQRAIRRASRHFYSYQQKSMQAGATYELHIVHHKKLGDLDDQIALKIRRSGHFSNVKHIASGDRKVQLRCRSRHSPALVRRHLRQLLKQMPAIRSVRTPTSWHRVVVVLINH